MRRLVIEKEHYDCRSRLYWQVVHMMCSPRSAAFLRFLTFRRSWRPHVQRTTQVRNFLVRFSIGSPIIVRLPNCEPE